MQCAQSRGRYFVHSNGGKAPAFAKAPVIVPQGEEIPQGRRKIYKKISGGLNCLILAFSYIVGFSSSFIPKAFLDATLLKLLDKAPLPVTLG